MHWTGLLVVASLMTGCAHMYDVTDECVMKWKCSHEAKMAWIRCRDLYANVAYPFDFGQGFRAGYEAICLGGDGCRPPMPPRHYWSHHYQCDEGKCQIMAWYDGYHHGVLAAQCDGCEGRCQVLCASDLYGEKPCEADYSDIEHSVVPEEEMPLYGEELPGYGPAGIPDYGMPMNIPPAPAVPEYGAPLAPEGGYGPGVDAGPTPVPGLQDSYSPSAESTFTPAF